LDPESLDPESLDPESLDPESLDPESLDPESLEAVDPYSLFSRGGPYDPIGRPVLRLSFL